MLPGKNNYSTGFRQHGQAPATWSGLIQALPSEMFPENLLFCSLLRDLLWVS